MISPFGQVRNLKISQSLMLSITHSLTNAFSRVIHQVQGGDSCETKKRFRHDGFIPSLLPILSTTDNTSKKRQQKKEEAKLNTHTQREVISNTKDPSQKQCLFF
jgi:hypothetical protein